MQGQGMRLHEIQMERLRMILLTAIINEQEPEGAILIRFSGQDIMGSSEAEGDVADALRDAMIKKRDELFQGKDWNKVDIKHSYTRGFTSEEERDKRK